jgi:pyridoxine 4-dehydrogenase
VRTGFPERIVVATKGGYEPGANRPERLRAELEESFERLGADTIDLYYLHRFQPDVPLADSLGVLREHRQAGRIRHVGLSQVGVDEIERARDVVPIEAVQDEFNLAERKYDPVVDFCEREGLVFVPFYPLRAKPPGLGEIARRYDASPEQIALAWLLRRSPCIVPIPGTRSTDHLRENVGALELELSDEDYATLDRV